MSGEIKIKDRPLAFTDTETTGLEPVKYKNLWYWPSKKPVSKILWIIIALICSLWLGLNSITNWNDSAKKQSMNF